ncbi:MAG: hypothetical protein AB7G48_15650 [Nitrospiraceae bacterium]
MRRLADVGWRRRQLINNGISGIVSRGQEYYRHINVLVACVIEGRRVVIWKHLLTGDRKPAPESIHHRKFNLSNPGISIALLR